MKRIVNIEVHKNYCGNTLTGNFTYVRDTNLETDEFDTCIFDAIESVFNGIQETDPKPFNKDEHLPLIDKKHTRIRIKFYPPLPDKDYTVYANKTVEYHLVEVDFFYEQNFMKEYVEGKIFGVYQTRQDKDYTDWKNKPEYQITSILE